jgi:hypothetical protein
VIALINALGHSILFHENECSITRQLQPK